MEDDLVSKGVIFHFQDGWKRVVDVCTPCKFDLFSYFFPKGFLFCSLHVCFLEAPLDSSVSALERSDDKLG